VDDQNAFFGNITGAEVTITVTNTFEGDPPAPVDPPPDVQDDVVTEDVVSGSPAFTG
jgi:hypothetical protein